MGIIVRLNIERRLYIFNSKPSKFQNLFQFFLQEHFRHIYRLLSLSLSISLSFHYKKIINFSCKASVPKSDRFKASYRMFIKYCVFSLKFWDCSELCQFCCSAGVLPAWLCTHTNTLGKQRKTRVRNILKSSKKHNIIYNTLYKKYCAC